VIGLFLAEIVLGTQTLENTPVEFKQMVREYTIYCAPLAVWCLAGFVKNFSEKWLLQTFGGAIEQGLYGVAFQIAIAISLFTTSIQKIFWKETAEGIEKQDLGKVEKLYKRVTRILFAISAAISGFLMPWSREIIEVLLGVSYLGGVWTFRVLLIYPLYHALAATTSALYFTSSKTMMRAKIGMVFLGIHILVTYFVVAPRDAWLPGLELGSYGIALKLIILQIISVNVMTWWISKDYGWKYDWDFQIIVLLFSLGLGWACHEMVFGISGVFFMNLFAKFGLALIVYFSMASFAVWKRPDLAGVTQEDIRNFIGQVMRFCKVKA
jgi:O-antigen/teichoic acid export membrane protein